MKAELFSTALRLDDRLYLVDPIPLADPAWEELTRDASVCGIFVTNANHERAVRDFAAQTGAAVLAAPAAASTLWNLEAICVEADEQVGERLRVIEIEGAVEGEIALHFDVGRRALILGDALINFGSDGFALLPAEILRGSETDAALASSVARLLLRAPALRARVCRSWTGHGQSWSSCSVDAGAVYLIDL